MLLLMLTGCNYESMSPSWLIDRTRILGVQAEVAGEPGLAEPRPGDRVVFRSLTVHPDYARGLDPEGAVAIEEFVRAGGTLVTLGASSQWAIELFELPLTDESRKKDSEFSCPGSVLRAIPEDSAWTAGLPESVNLFFSRSRAWSLPKKEKGKPQAEGLEVLLRYAPTRVLLSGWIREPQAIEGQAAWVRAEHGEGQVHLFGFRPQYRGWSQDAFELLYRAVLLEP